MSDLLSGLSDPGAAAIGLGGYVHKDAVREALRNPTGSEVRRIADATALPEWVVRVVLNRAAGGDR